MVTFGKIIRGLFSSKPETIATTEDMKRLVREMLREDKEMAELVALLNHQEAMLASITPQQLKEMQHDQMSGSPRFTEAKIAETETKIAKLLGIKSRHQEEFREVLDHLKNEDKKNAKGRNLDVAA
ncbi:hypothetical protein J4206_04585 [Candidatus Woesearchaeota archaeon]|nr:hypothetical protein [Candidatus Woesearchaeota archaeon]